MNIAMLPAFDIFKDEITQIENYMTSISYYNQIMMIDVSKSRAPFKDKIINLQRANGNFNKRKYDYSLIIVSLYGCFEQFVESFIKDYLMLLAEDCQEYSRLPQVIIDNHINLSVTLMGKIEQSKYNEFLTKEQIIRNLNDCIQHNKCSINYEAFCQHTANFRVQTIGEVLKNVGLSDVLNRVKDNEHLREMYVQQNGECDYGHLKLDNVFSFLNELADRRNKIAHGAVSDILSVDLQEELIKKVSFFGQEMDKIGFEEVLPYLVGKAHKITKIYNPNKSTNLLCFAIMEGKICIGDIIIIKNSHDNYTYSKIESIEIDHVRYDKIEIQNEVNIGIMLDKYRKVDEEYWIYNMAKPY